MELGGSGEVPGTDIDVGWQVAEPLRFLAPRRRIGKPLERVADSVEASRGMCSNAADCPLQSSPITASSKEQSLQGHTLPMCHECCRSGTKKESDHTS